MVVGKRLPHQSHPLGKGREESVWDIRSDFSECGTAARKDKSAGLGKQTPHYQAQVPRNIQHDGASQHLPPCSSQGWEIRTGPAQRDLSLLWAHWLCLSTLISLLMPYTVCTMYSHFLCGPFSFLTAAPRRHCFVSQPPYIPRAFKKQFLDE